MTSTKSGENSSWLRRVLRVLVGVAIVAVGPWVAFGPDPREESADIWPEPVEPFGMVRAADLRFVWSTPVDGAPVRVDVLDPGMTLLWRSGATTAGFVRPEDEVLAILPAGDLVWRPVAVPGDGPERVSDAAVFHLVKPEGTEER